MVEAVVLNCGNVMEDNEKRMNGVTSHVKHTNPFLRRGGIPGACLNDTSINSPKWVVFNAFKL
jgi:hypothetical protein